MPPWTAPGSAGADTTRQPASPLVNLTGRDLVGDAERAISGAFAVKRAVPAARGQPAPR